MNFSDDLYFFEQPNEEQDGYENIGLCYVKSITRNNRSTFGVHLFFLAGAVEGYIPVFGNQTFYLTTDEMENYFRGWEDGAEWLRINQGDEDLDEKRCLVECAFNGGPA